MDEPPPLGHDASPNPARILAAAIGDCLSASLVFCLKRRGIVVSGLRSEVHVQLVRNDKKRLRIGKVEVAIHPESPIPEEAMEACLKTFEDFCVVTQSVRGWARCRGTRRAHVWWDCLGLSSVAMHIHGRHPTAAARGVSHACMFAAALAAVDSAQT
jgi:uncharacterized OsmC-like protein